MEFSIVKLPLVVFFNAVIYILPAGVGQNDCTACFFRRLWFGELPPQSARAQHGCVYTLPVFLPFLAIRFTSCSSWDCRARAE